MQQERDERRLWAMDARDIATLTSEIFPYCGIPGATPDYAILRKNLEQAASNGDVNAAIILAAGLENNHPFPTDMGEIIKWRMMAGEGGHIPSLISVLELCVMNAGKNVAGGYERCVYFLEKLDQLGQAEAAFYLGVCYDYGLGVAADRKTAVQYYTRAVQGGSIPAKFWAVFFLQAGEYLTPDIELARRLGAELDRSVRPFKYPDYEVWPKFFDYLGGVAQVYGMMSDAASKACYIRELLLIFIRVTGHCGGPHSTAINKACQNMLSTLSDGDWERSMAMTKARFEEFPTIIHKGVPERGQDAHWSYTVTFVNEQYRYGDICTVNPGDTAMCCGACIGDSSMWLRQCVGPTGKVYAFEPVPTIFPDLVKTLEYNHADNVFPFQMAIGKVNGPLKFDFVTFGSSHASDSGDIEVEGISIDKFCRDHNVIPNYIKMDIEGEELSACQGAREIITRHKPRLGVCLYHKPFRDFLEIPKLLKEFRPDYRFYIKKSAKLGEIVMFAV